MWAFCRFPTSTTITTTTTRGATQAIKVCSAYLKVFPKRRGVLYRERHTHREM